MDPSRATQLALGYWPARAFSAAVELGIFDLLAGEALDASAVADGLGLASPSVVDLLDALVGLGALERDGDRYRAAGPVGEVAGLADGEAYRAWADLPAALRGVPRPSMFEALAADPAALDRFADAMAAVSAPLHEAVIEHLGAAGTVCDLGGADARFGAALAARRPEVRVVSIDLPAFVPLAEATVAAAGVADRVTVVGGDFFVDPVPHVDVVVLCLVLLDWPPEAKRRLLEVAAGALDPGGSVVVVDRLEGGRPERTTFELLRSLHLLVTQGDAHPYSAEELARWLDEAGFGAPALTSLAGGFSLAVAVRTG